MRWFLASSLAAAVGIGGCTKAGLEANGRHAWTQAGLLRIAVSEEPKNLNPLLAATTTEVFIDRLLFEPLVSADRRGNPVPILATEVPQKTNGGISADGLTVRYHLRPNAYWTDGVPVTARDVLWSFHAIVNPNNNVVARHGYDDVRSIAAPDDHTVVVHLIRAFAPFVTAFFGESDQPYDVLPAHALARFADINQLRFNSAPTVTDGPFRFESWQRGDRLRFTANARFFEGAPRLRSIEIRFVPNEDTEVNLLRTHAIDYIYEPSLQTYPALRSISGTRIVWLDANGYEGLMFNLGRPIVSDPLVRRAIAAAIDKSALTASLTHGQASVATEDLPNWMWAFDPSVQSEPFDPEAAATMLARAGWRAGPDGSVRKQGRPMLLLLATDSETAIHRSESLLIQAALRRIGIEVEIKTFPQSILYAPMGMGGIAHGGKFDLLLYPWVSGTDPDNSSQFTCTNVPPHGYDDSRYCSRAMDDAQNTALTHYDRATRRIAYSRIERLLSVDNPLVFFWWQRLQEPISVDFKGFDPNPAVESWNAWQWRI